MYVFRYNSDMKLSENHALSIIPYTRLTIVLFGVCAIMCWCNLISVPCLFHLNLNVMYIEHFNNSKNLIQIQSKSDNSPTIHNQFNIVLHTSYYIKCWIQCCFNWINLLYYRRRQCDDRVESMQQKNNKYFQRCEYGTEVCF